MARRHGRRRVLLLPSGGSPGRERVCGRRRAACGYALAASSGRVRHRRSALATPLDQHRRGVTAPPPRRSPRASSQALWRQLCAGRLVLDDLTQALGAYAVRPRASCVPGHRVAGLRRRPRILRRRRDHRCPLPDRARGLLARAETPGATNACLNRRVGSRHRVRAHISRHKPRWTMASA